MGINMKRYLMLFVLLALLSCDEQVDTEKPKLPCDMAKDHIVFCVGYLPSFTCDEELARKILSTKCENITSLWR